jgi:hypothetical protein
MSDNSIDHALQVGQRSHVRVESNLYRIGRRDKPPTKCYPQIFCWVLMTVTYLYGANGPNVNVLRSHGLRRIRLLTLKVCQAFTVISNNAFFLSAPF